MAEVLAIAYDPAQVLHQLQSQKTRLDLYGDNVRAFLNQIADLAEALLDTDKPQTEAAQTTAKSLLELEAETKAYAAALEAVKNQYVPSERTTDFQQEIGQHAKRLLSVFRTDPKDNETYQDFCTQLGIDEQEEEEDEEDDDIQMERGAFMNNTCPLSGKPILEIEEPVIDQKGYVYEKGSVTIYVRQHGGEAQCPTGATHTISLANLKKAHKVIRSQKKALKQGSQHQTQQQSQDVVDVD